MTDPIGRIEEALTRLGAEHEPPVGWEARVLAATTPPKRRARWWFAVSIPSVAAVAAIVLLWPQAHGFALVVTLDRDSVVVRGGKAPHAGDVAHATVTGGGRYRAVWIYRDDELVAACPGGGATQCRSSSEAPTSSEAPAAQVTLTMGKYQIVALTSSAPIPLPAGKLDPDLARARSSGATLKQEHLTVR